MKVQFYILLQMYSKITTTFMAPPFHSNYSSQSTLSKPQSDCKDKKYFKLFAKSQNYPKLIKYPPKPRFRPDHHEGSPRGPVCLYRREANLLRHRSKPSSCGDQGTAEGDWTGRGGTQALLSSPSSIQLFSLS